MVTVKGSDLNCGLRSHPHLSLGGVISPTKRSDLFEVVDSDLLVRDTVYSELGVSVRDLDLPFDALRDKSPTTRIL